MNRTEVARRLSDLDDRMAKVEARVGSIEEVHTKFLDGFGKYKSRSREELTLIQTQLVGMIASIESLVSVGENQSDIERARQLLRRARNNHTRATSALHAA